MFETAQTLQDPTTSPIRSADGAPVFQQESSSLPMVIDLQLRGMPRYPISRKSPTVPRALRQLSLT